MKKLYLMLSLALLSLPGVVMASSPYASSSEPHGIVDLDIASPAKGQFEAFFLEIDGKNIVSGRKQLLLTPGTYKIKLGAKITEYAPGLTRSSNLKKPENVVEIEVKEGVRYSVAALVEQSKAEWKAIVTKESEMK